MDLSNKPPLPLLTAMLASIDRTVQNLPSRADLHSVARLAYRQLLQVERTRKVWADPLRLFPYDPVKLSVIEFNAGLRERNRDLRRSVETLAQERARLQGILEGRS